MTREQLQVEIGLVVKKARIQCGITQVELAKRIGSNQPVLARIESGRALPSLDYMLNIAQELGAHLNVPYFDFWQSASSTVSTKII